MQDLLRRALLSPSLPPTLSFPPEAQGEFFSSLDIKNVLGLLEIKLREVLEVPKIGSLWLFNSQANFPQASSNLSIMTSSVPIDTSSFLGFCIWTFPATRLWFSISACLCSGQQFALWLQLWGQEGQLPRSLYVEPET